MLEVGVDVASFGRQRHRQHVWFEAGAVAVEVDLVAQ